MYAHVSAKRIARQATLVVLALFAIIAFNTLMSPQSQAAPQDDSHVYSTSAGVLTVITTWTGEVSSTGKFADRQQFSAIKQCNGTWIDNEGSFRTTAQCTENYQTGRQLLQQAAGAYGKDVRVFQPIAQVRVWQPSTYSTSCVSQPAPAVQLSLVKPADGDIAIYRASVGGCQTTPLAFGSISMLDSDLEVLGYDPSHQTILSYKSNVAAADYPFGNYRTLVLDRTVPSSMIGAPVLQHGQVIGMVLQSNPSSGTSFGGNNDLIAIASERFADQTATETTSNAAAEAVNAQKAALIGSQAASTPTQANDKRDWFMTILLIIITVMFTLFVGILGYVGYRLHAAFKQTTPAITEAGASLQTLSRYAGTLAKQNAGKIDAANKATPLNRMQQNDPRTADTNPNGNAQIKPARTNRTGPNTGSLGMRSRHSEQGPTDRT